jgi:hypothetical protein
MTTNQTYSAGYFIGYDSTQSSKGKQSLVIQTDSLSVPIFPDTDSNAYLFTANYILQNGYVNKKFNNNKIKNIKPIYAAFPIFVGADFFETPIQDSQFVTKNIITYETYPIHQLTPRNTGKNDSFLLS